MKIYVVTFAETQSGIEMGAFTKHFKSLASATQHLVTRYRVGAGEAMEMKSEVNRDGLYFFDKVKAREKARESEAFFFPRYIQEAELL